MDFTISPLQTFEDLCFEDESQWQRFTYQYALGMKVVAVILVLVSFTFIWGIKTKESSPIIAFLYVASINALGLIIYAVLLLKTNIIDSLDECDFPNISYKDVVMRTLFKMLTSVFFSCIYIYMVIAAKSYYQSVNEKPKPIRDLHEKSLKIQENPLSHLPVIQEN